eukprot:3579670-Rhodomonas_salina.3
MSSTDVAYHDQACYLPTRLLCDVRYSRGVSAYALAMRCPVLTWRMVLPAVVVSLPLVDDPGTT